jgi:hypothetical protein
MFVCIGKSVVSTPQELFISPHYLYLHRVNVMMISAIFTIFIEKWHFSFKNIGMIQLLQ